MFTNSQSTQYLLAEYQQCFNHMRHYDGIIISVIKYSFTILAAVISIGFAFFKFFAGEPYQIPVLIAILSLAFLIGLISIILILKNRVYFVDVTRQVNSLRSYFLSNSSIDFIKHNVLPIDPAKPFCLNFGSSFFWQLFIILLLDSSILGAITYLTLDLKQGGELISPFSYFIIGTVVTLVLEFLFSCLYLKIHR